MTPEDLRARLAIQAVAIERATRAWLAESTCRDAVLQLRRASTSTAANHRAAGRARSYAEFAAKLGLAVEEADEVLYWLQHLDACRLVPAAVLTPLMDEARQLVAILTASHRTVRRKMKKNR